MRRVVLKGIAIVLLVVVTASLTGFVALRKIRSLHPQFASELVYAELDGQPITVDALSNLEIYLGATLRIYLVGEDGTSLFLDQNDSPIPTPDVTMSRMRAASAEIFLETVDASAIAFTPTLGYAKGNTEISSAAPYIEIYFSSDKLLMQDESFALECGISLFGKVQEESRIHIAGTVLVGESAVFAEDSVIDIRDGKVAYAWEDTGEIAVVMSDEITMYTSLEGGQRYSALVRRPADYPDAPVRDIVAAYELETVSFDSEHSRVKIEADRILHVYDGAGEYLGTTNHQLPYRDSYYLTSRRMA